MAYLALYRRFRPSDFNSVIGQEPIVKTLTNQIITDKVSHAYLFCGARGTGKTSLAKIFARAVNCENPINGSPCGKCKSCLALKDPSNVDVVEIDAASNNKVENVREIRESVQYPPVSVKYKVYIIDEVHMLTTEAFNALLKTLEEPPKHAIFILATTEPHKLPATILSRCMRFDFKLIPTKKIAELISGIYDEVGKKYDDEAVTLIAKAGEGSVRDALSIADLCVSLGDRLSYSDVLTVLGATDQSLTDSLIEAVFNGDTGSVLEFTDKLSSLGKSIGLLAKDVVNYLRDIAVIKTCKNAKEILALPEDRFLSMQKVASLSDNHRILRCIEIVSSIETSLRYSTQPRAVLETALIKATMPEKDYNIDALLARIKTLEDAVESLTKNGVKTVTVEKVVEKPIEKVVEKPIEKVVEEKPIEVKSKNMVDNDFGLIPPPEEEFEINIPTPPKKPAVVAEEKPKAIKVDGNKVWGGIVRKLRITPNKTILWVACQEMTASVVDNELTIFASSENEKRLLIQEDNFKTLTQIAKDYGVEKIKVITGKIEESVNTLETAKAFFGDKLKIDN